MSEPQSFLDKKRFDPYIADHQIIVGLAVNKYDAVWKVKKRKKGQELKGFRGTMVEQGAQDLSTCK